MGNGKCKVRSHSPFSLDACIPWSRCTPTSEAAALLCGCALSSGGYLGLGLLALLAFCLFLRLHTNLVLIFLFACLFASELHYPVDLIVDEIMSLAVGVDSMFVAICFCMNCLCLDCFV